MAFTLDIREDEQSLGLFSWNYHALKRLLEANEEVSKAITATDQHEIMEIVAFLLHNYVSSAMSLVVHTRNLNRRLYEKTNPEALMEIQKEIDRQFVRNETHQIIQGLRDFTQHRKLPVIGRVMSFNALEDAPKLEAAYYLSTQSLLEWDGWKPQAKQKLKSMSTLSLEEQVFEHKKKHLPINPLVTEHYGEAAAFYEWLANKRRELLVKPCR